MTEFVEVTVKLPKIEGYEYSGEFRPPKKGDWWLSLGQLPNMAFVDSEIDSPRLILRPIKPATVTVTLRREDAEWLFAHTVEGRMMSPGNEITKRIAEACKAALGEEQKCGMPLHRLSTGEWDRCSVFGPGDGHQFKPCALPRGHVGNHAPESLP